MRKRDGARPADADGMGKPAKCLRSQAQYLVTADSEASVRAGWEYAFADMKRGEGGWPNSDSGKASLNPSSTAGHDHVSSLLGLDRFQ